MGLSIILSFILSSCNSDNDADNDQNPDNPNLTLILGEWHCDKQVLIETGQEFDESIMPGNIWQWFFFNTGKYVAMDLSMSREGTFNVDGNQISCVHKNKKGNIIQETFTIQSVTDKKMVLIGDNGRYRWEFSIVRKY